MQVVLNFFIIILEKDFLGYAETTLGEIIGAPGGCVLRKLQ